MIELRNKQLINKKNEVDELIKFANRNITKREDYEKALDKAIEIARERKECLDVVQRYFKTGEWPEYYRGVKLPKKVKLELV